MKKLFVSVPMKGRKKENIKRDIEKMHKIAEAVFGEELELLDSYIEENPPEGCNVPVWYLGKSVELIAQADYFIGIERWMEAFKGCEIERKVAVNYNIARFFINPVHLSPDILEIENYVQEAVFRNQCCAPVRG